MEKISLLGVGKYNIPEMKPLGDGVSQTLHRLEWFTFKDAKSHYMRDKDPAQCGIHFYLDDKWFNAVWSSPRKYIDFFKKFGAIHTPDFSMYTDWPMAVQIYNHYRKMWIGAWWQHHGLDVIPTIAWSTPESYDWCFDGVPKNTVVSVSSVGVWNDDDAYAYFCMGCREMIERLDPFAILWRGKVPEEFSFHNIIPIKDQGDLHFKERHTNVKKESVTNDSL